MRTAIVLAAVMAASACTTVQRRDTEKVVAQAVISDEQERELGFQVHEQLKKENTKFLNNPVVESYVEGLVRRLAPFADKDRVVRWQYFVIDDPNTVNAFATPGGRIYVYTGLLLAADNEAEVAGVLGHEMGHVVARHSARQLVATYGLDAVAKMAMGENAGDVARVTSALAGKGALLAYGRDMELEADEYGARYADAAGLDPRGLIDFFQKLQAKAGAQPGFMVWLSTHPANQERIDKLAAYIVSHDLQSRDAGADRLKPVQAALGKR